MVVERKRKLRNRGADEQKREFVCMYKGTGGMRRPGEMSGSLRKAVGRRAAGIRGALSARINRPGLAQASVSPAGDTIKYSTVTIVQYIPTCTMGTDHGLVLHDRQPDKPEQDREPDGLEPSKGSAWRNQCCKGWDQVWPE